jgi:hypothetical protein
VDWRRVVFYAALMAIAIVLVWKAWERRFESRLAAFEAQATEPAPLSPPLTDVSEWSSRNALLHHRETMLDLLDLDDWPPSHNDRLLFDRCGKWDSRDVEFDEIRLTYFDTWFRDAFSVVVRPQPGTAVATWNRVAMNPPPKPPGSAGARSDASDLGLLTLTSTETRIVPSAGWQRILAALGDPAFSKLAPGNLLGPDGFNVMVESCLSGRYHLVSRWSPNGDEDAPLWATARVIEREAGSVFTMPGYSSVESTEEEEQP